MAVLTKADLNPFRSTAGYTIERGRYVSASASKFRALSEAAETTRFDIFLSHKYSDADELMALYNLLTHLKFTVYVDWKEDVELDRSRVTAETANRLRVRMRMAKCLLFVTSSTSDESKWMPWELGFKDGLDGRVAICPVMSSTTPEFQGQEYLGIYPYLDKTGDSLWIHRNVSTYGRFTDWLEGRKI